MDRLSERDAEIFQILVVHWINHNREHTRDYREWMNKSHETAPEVAQAIEAAVSSMDKAAQKLMDAKIAFQQKQ